MLRERQYDANVGLPLQRAQLPADRVEMMTPDGQGSGEYLAAGQRSWWRARSWIGDKRHLVVDVVVLFSFCFGFFLGGFRLYSIHVHLRMGRLT